MDTHDSNFFFFFFLFNYNSIVNFLSRNLIWNLKSKYNVHYLSEANMMYII